MDDKLEKRDMCKETGTAKYKIRKHEIQLFKNVHKYFLENT